MNLDWGHDDRCHTRQGPPILTRYEGAKPKVNVVVSEEMYRKITAISKANGWAFSRASRYVLASGLNSLRAVDGATVGTVTPMVEPA